ncbi:siderophore-interacting protein [Actinoplanes sp. LDG1-06]|uniref:Siderophore-interacting protein n=1 Tax=Paractinoplanes ovalisporus TaxID=2810368 RepID=A0ABS2A2U9_9ACTN|nr:siderophore-interacting protein [Actinoplanes ovalisporus]
MAAACSPAEAAACSPADLAAVESCLAADVVAWCDSGGVVAAPLSPVWGAAEVALLLIATLAHTTLTVESVNGRPGLVARSPTGTAVSVVGAANSHAVITHLWMVLNPAKLTRWHRH